MVVVSDPDLSWAVTKAALVVVSAFASVVCLAWVGGRKAFPSESEKQQVEETAGSWPCRPGPRDANWSPGGEVEPGVLGPIRKVLIAEFYPSNITSAPRKRPRTVAVQVSKNSSEIIPRVRIHFPPPDVLPCTESLPTGTP
jgi:hypothetical protein